MEFNIDNFNKLVEENNRLKQKINQLYKDKERREIIHLVEMFSGCPWGIVGNLYDGLNSKDKECSGKCTECKNEFWSSVDEYLNNKYFC